MTKARLAWDLPHKGQGLIVSGPKIDWALIVSRPSSPCRGAACCWDGGSDASLASYLDTPGGAIVTMTVKDLTKHTFRKGELVRVRSAEEILSTLDSDGTVDGLVFMPEMLQFAGQEVPMRSSAHKTCDGAAEIREMDNTVHLEGLRCDGGAHDGCQAACPLFWREEWLAPASEPQPAASTMTDEAALATLMPKTRRTNDAGESVYRCQATDVRLASRPLSQLDPRQYIRDLTSRNITLRVFVVGLAVHAFKKYQQLTERVLPRRLRIKGGKSYPFYQGTGTGERTPIVDVAPGQLVEIRTKDEIMPTLGPDNRNRRMWFDPEMVPHCGARATSTATFNASSMSRPGR